MESEYGVEEGGREYFTMIAFTKIIDGDQAGYPELRGLVSRHLKEMFRDRSCPKV